MSKSPFAALSLPGVPGLVALCLLIGGPGCVQAPSYSIDVRSPHKDTVEMSIWIESDLPTGVYQEIAAAELEMVLATRPETAPDLYRARFVFQDAGESRRQFATVIARFAPSTLSEERPSITWRTHLH